MTSKVFLFHQYGILDSDLIDLTLKMTSAQVVETSVKVTTNSPSQDYTHPDDHNLRTYDMTPGFKPFTIIRNSVVLKLEIWGMLHSCKFPGASISSYSQDKTGYLTEMQVIVSSKSGMRDSVLL